MIYDSKGTATPVQIKSKKRVRVNNKAVNCIINSCSDNLCKLGNMA